MKKIRLALQKSGRLHDESLQILKNCGIEIQNGKNQLKVASSNFPLEVFFLRNSDIPGYLIDNVVDIAVIGENLLQEKGDGIIVNEYLGFSKCRVSIAVPNQSDIKKVSDLQSKSIATSYPKTLKRFLEEHQVNSKIHVINGSVEIAPNIGLADAVCDIVSSGSTLFNNNLKEIKTILKSEAVLCSSPSIDEYRTELLNRLLFRIRGVLSAKKFKYLLMNAPADKVDKIISLLPGMKSPTIIPLADKSWFSIHTVIKMDEFWNVIDLLKESGAQGILICPIDKMFI
tara:strand:+ start:40 stop:897 length:858 start_codon:yes stop_codon:yes gene_type:complete